MIQLIAILINDPTNCHFNESLLPMTFQGFKTPTGDQTLERGEKRFETIVSVVTLIMAKYNVLLISILIVVLQLARVKGQGEVINALDFRLKPLRCAIGFYGQSDCLCFDTGAEVLTYNGRPIRVVNCKCWLETFTTLQSFVNELVRPVTIQVSKCKGMRRREAAGGA